MPEAQVSPAPAAVQENTHDPEEAAIVAHQAENVIEADLNQESDEGYETDGASRASTSLSSSVRNYVFENGRRYHKFREGIYQFPNDEPEQERENMKHAMIVTLCGGKLHYAPLDRPQRVLDIGTGTGAWCIDMGDEYQAADVMGLDLSPIQPEWVPQNVRFVVDDFESTWLHGDNYFDFIHARHLSGSIKKGPFVMSEAYRSLKPGGWIEIQDMEYSKYYCDDGTIPENYQVQEWASRVSEALTASGIDMGIILKYPQELRDAGFINVVEKVFKLPIGPWPKNKTLKMIGLYSQTAIWDGLSGLALGPLTRTLGWTPEQVEVFLVGARKDLMKKSIHSYYKFHVVYGQKPL